MERALDPDAGGGEAGARPVVYCLVPRDLADKLHEPLRRHFRDDPDVQVVVEWRTIERRRPADRRRGGAPLGPERRRIRGRSGRRAGERRAPLIDAAPRALPRRARAYADRLQFVERLEPSTQQLEDLDTARVVDRFQSGEVEVFSVLYTRYFDRIYGYVRVIVGNAHQAEEATQEVFTRVFEGLPRYERRDKPFRSWLFTVVRHHALDLLRERRRVEVMDPEEVRRRRPEAPQDTADLDVLNWISDPELLMFIERLPLVQRQVLMLRYMLDLQSPEIAEILGRSREDVRVLQHRAVKFLKERLAAVGRHPRRQGEIRMRVYPKQLRILRNRRFVLR